MQAFTHPGNYFLGQEEWMTGCQLHSVRRMIIGVLLPVAGGISVWLKLRRLVILLFLVQCIHSLTYLLRIKRICLTFIQHLYGCWSVWSGVTCDTVTWWHWHINIDWRPLRLQYMTCLLTVQSCLRNCQTTLRHIEKARNRWLAMTVSSGWKQNSTCFSDSLKLKQYISNCNIFSDGQLTKIYLLN